MVLMGIVSFASAASENPHKLDVGALIQTDISTFGGFFKRNAQSGEEFSIRRARLTGEYRFRKLWKAELSVQYSDQNDEFNLHDAWLKYRGAKSFDITVGKFKQPFGLQRTEGTSARKANERATVVTALAPGRDWGVKVHKEKKRSSWALGVFQHESDDDFINSAPLSITGRVTKAPIREKREVLHLGLSASYTDWNDNLFRIGERAELGVADNIVRSARFNASSQALLGLEAAWQKNRFHVRGEYMISVIEASNFSSELTYDGFYAQASYLIGGKQGKYNNGKFSRVRKQKGRSAFELVARYSDVDLRDNPAMIAVGAESVVGLLGVNWYVSKHLRASINCISTDIVGDTLHQNLDGDAVTVSLMLRL